METSVQQGGDRHLYQAGPGFTILFTTDVILYFNRFASLMPNQKLHASNQ